MPDIIIHEVGPRDGLQVEKQVVPTDKKLGWIRALAAAGVDIVQVGSFVHPEKVPQMADTDELFRTARRRASTARTMLSGLVLNEKGLERGLACGVEMFCLGVSASETHSRRTPAWAPQEAQRRIIATAQAGAWPPARRCRSRCRAPSAAASRARSPRSACSASCARTSRPGSTNISLADTAGHAHPAQVRAAVRQRSARSRPTIQCTCHFHDTYGLGMANIYAALEPGVTSFETSFAGLGGCPFTKVAAGNVATEDLVHALQRAGPAPRTSISTRSSPWPATWRLISAARCRAGSTRPDRSPTEAGAAMTNRPRILDGIRVLDLTNVLSGPFASLHLALLGAEVIKIENPKDGDLARKLGIVPDYNKRLMGTSFLAQNCNKKSVTLNTKSPEGKEIFKQLVKDADVVIENFRPDVMDRLGLGYDVLREINPRLVYCAISGFGQTGPDAVKPAYDQIIQGLSGEMAVNGDERLSPLRAGFPVCDTVGGLNAAFAVMAALYHRERTGEGQFIDVALLDSIMPLMGWVAANLLIGGQRAGGHGQRQLHRGAERHLHARMDGHINIAANKQEQWEAVCDVLGAAGAEDRPALPGARHPQEEPQGAHAAARGEARPRSPRRTGSRRSTPGTSRAARS